MIQETNAAKATTGTKNNKYYQTTTKWFVSLPIGEVVLRPMNPMTDDTLTKPSHMKVALDNIISIKDTEGNACVVTCEVIYESLNRDRFHFFMDGCCEKGVRGQVNAELRDVVATSIVRNGSDSERGALFS